MQIFGNTTLEELRQSNLISVRTLNACTYAGLTTVDDLVNYGGIAKLRDLPHIGKKCMEELQAVFDSATYLTKKTIIERVPRKRSFYSVQHTKKIKEILDSSKVDNYAISCISGPIINVISLDDFRQGLDFKVSIFWRESVLRATTIACAEIRSYLSDNYFRWNNIELLYDICFNRVQLLNKQRWSSVEVYEKFVFFLWRTVRNFSQHILFCSEVNNNNLEYFIYNIQEEIKDFCYFGGNRVIFEVEVLNEYYHHVLSEYKNNFDTAVIESWAPDYFDVLFLASIKEKAFFDRRLGFPSVLSIPAVHLYILFHELSKKLIVELSVDSLVVEKNNLKFELSLFPDIWLESAAAYKFNHGYLPMFSLLYRLLTAKVLKKSDIYCDYYGIGTIKIHNLIRISKKYNLTQPTVQSYLKKIKSEPILLSLLEHKGWENYPILKESVLYDYMQELRDIIESEDIDISVEALVEGVISLFEKYDHFEINGYHYWFKLSDFPNGSPVSGLNKLCAFKKNGVLESMTVYMLELFGDQDFNNWRPFSIISQIIENEIGFSLIDNEYIDIEPKFDTTKLIIQIFERSGKAMSVQEVTDEYNKLVTDGFVEPDLMKTRLSRMNGVNSIGKTGKYALPYLEDTYFGTIRDLAVEVIDEYNQPVSLNILMNRIYQFFPESNLRSVDSLLRQSQTRYTFFVQGNRYYCSQDDRDSIYETIAELNPTSETDRLSSMKSFLMGKHRFPLRKGNIQEASLREWIHSVLSGEIILSPESKEEFNHILRNYRNDDPDDPTNKTIRRFFF